MTNGALITYYQYTKYTKYICSEACIVEYSNNTRLTGKSLHDKFLKTKTFLLSEMSINETLEVKKFSQV